MTGLISGKVSLNVVLDSDANIVNLTSEGYQATNLRRKVRYIDELRTIIGQKAPSHLH